jgi:tetratricopeptide (TPR) repeat protein
MRVRLEWMASARVGIVRVMVASALLLVHGSSLPISVGQSLADPSLPPGPVPSGDVQSGPVLSDEGAPPTATGLAPTVAEETLAAASADAQEALDPQAMVRVYQEARGAFQKQEWSQAASRFRQVGRSCPGTALALECNYMALQADWQQRQPGCYESLAAWLEEAERAKGKVPSPTSSKVDGWVNQVQMMMVQWERNTRQWGTMETRLRSLLHLAGGHRDSRYAWPEELAQTSVAWLELGSLLSREHRNWGEAIECLQKAMALGGLSHEHQCAAQAELTRCHLETGAMAAAIEDLATLEKMVFSDASKQLADGGASWKIRWSLLRSSMMRSQQEWLGAAEALQPAVELALASRPEALLVYELALALLEAEQHSTAEALFLEIIHRDPKSSVAVEARLRLAKRTAEAGDWDATRRHLDEALAGGGAEAWAAQAYFLRGRANVALKLPESARDDLEVALRYSQGQLELETAIRFDLAEALVQLQQWPEAKEHWDVLTRRGFEIAGVAAEAQPIPPASLPAWMATIWLRQAELLALQRGWGEAEQIVYRIREQFPECNRADEVDYLLARCHISKAQFDDARRLLVAIASNPDGRSPELVARSWWMVGETYMMQRNPAEAIASYRRVLDTEASRYWHSAAWMQMGQCFELLQEVAAARVAYQNLLDRDATGAFSDQARERLGALADRSPSVRTSKEGTGGKQR